MPCLDSLAFVVVVHTFDDVRTSYYVRAIVFVTSHKIMARTCLARHILRHLVRYLSFKTYFYLESGLKCTISAPGTLHMYTGGANDTEASCFEVQGTFFLCNA
jgi:hypothetical protein